MAQPALISVLISTYNTPERLQKVLWGYAGQTDRHFEIVIADDGSQDEVVAANKAALVASGLSHRYVWHSDTGFAKWTILNRAIEAATGDYLLMTDGDCIPEPDLIATHRARARVGHYLSGSYCRLSNQVSQAITQNHVAAAQIFTPKGLRELGPVSGSVARKLGAKEWGVASILDHLLRVSPTFNGNNSSAWKSDVLKINGFDERIGYGGGDREFGYRLRHAGVRPHRIRYSARMLHLDHPRGYADPEIIAKNRALIEQTQRDRVTATAYGLRDA